MVSVHRPSGPCPRPADWHEQLRVAVRVEFQVERFRPAPDDPVLRAPACRVVACTALALNRGIWCFAHARQIAATNPDIVEFIATAGPARTRVRANSQPCAVASCPNGAGVSLLCLLHHRQWMWAGRPDRDVWVRTARPAKTIASCAVAGCGRSQATAVGLCRSHLRDWDGAGRPELTTFAANAREVRETVPTFDLTGLSETVRLELQYVLQCRRDAGTARLTPDATATFVAVLRTEATLSSILDVALTEWERRVGEHPRGRGAPHPVAFARYAFDVLTVRATASRLLYDTDVWDLRRLGPSQPGGPRTIRFDDITIEWLRTAIKQWARLRVARIRASTVAGNVIHLRSFASFLQQFHPDKTDPSQLTRSVIEDYLASLARPAGQAPASKHISSLAVFLDDCRVHEWVTLPDSARVLRADFPRKLRPLARALDEHVMAQLETPSAMNVLPADGTRAIVSLLLATGLRSGDVVRLRFDPIVYDPSGAPFIDYFMHKLRKDHRVPIDDATVSVIRDQQKATRALFPTTPWLFPRLLSNADGQAFFSTATVVVRLQRWIETIDVTDRAGQPVRHIHPHQFRHTLGTRLINNGVPQHVVQKILGHDSSQMTDHYARLHDNTMREAFEAYNTRRVNIHGDHVPTYDPDPAAGDAAWMKERIARAQQSLPNGYCGRPLRHECPHPNACLTCPDFLTDETFLDHHRQQRAQTTALILSATRNGHHRMAAINQTIATNLDRIIDTLERDLTNDTINNGDGNDIGREHAR